MSLPSFQFIIMQKKLFDDNIRSFRNDVRKFQIANIHWDFVILVRLIYSIGFV